MPLYILFITFFFSILLVIFIIFLLAMSIIKFLDIVLFPLPLVRHSASTVIANLDLPKQDIACNTQRLHMTHCQIQVA